MVTGSIARGAALKEWAAVVKALEAGAQILVLRKGGIREEGFETDTEAFFFYPTGFHQSDGKLRSEHAHFMVEARSDMPPEGRVRISSFGRIAERFAISSGEKLLNLSMDYVYTSEEIKKRFEFRPGEAMTALAIRVYRLAAPADLPVKTKYGGCVSWVNLESDIPTAGAAPVLPDGEFNARLERIRSVLR